MPSDPTTRPIHRPGLPDHPVHGVTPGTRSPAPKATPGTPGDVPSSPERRSSVGVAIAMRRYQSREL